MIVLVSSWECMLVLGAGISRLEIVTPQMEGKGSRDWNQPETRIFFEKILQR